MSLYFTYLFSKYIFVFLKIAFFFLIDRSQKKDKKGKKPPKEGSTRLPKFPVVDFNTQKENATKCFPYYEVPKFRYEAVFIYLEFSVLFV